MTRKSIPEPHQALYNAIFQKCAAAFLPCEGPERECLDLLVHALLEIGLCEAAADRQRTHSGDWKSSPATVRLQRELQRNLDRLNPLAEHHARELARLQHTRRAAQIKAALAAPALTGRVQ